MKTLLASKRFQIGFTLVELLIVVAIIAILVSVGAVSYSTAQRNARNADRASELTKLAVALEEYFADHGSYIPTGHGGSYWGVTGGEFEGAGVDCLNPSQDERFCCLEGGSVASSFSDLGIWFCPPPYNTYITSDVRRRADILYEGTSNDAIYHYASDGQSFAIVTRHYEGIPPIGHRLSDSQFYYCEADNFQPFDWSHTYAVFNTDIRQPTDDEKAARPGWSTCS